MKPLTDGVVQRGGDTVTGEQGAGLLERTWLVAELGEDSLALQRGVTAVFDPPGVRDPGKAN